MMPLLMKTTFLNCKTVVTAVYLWFLLPHGVICSSRSRASNVDVNVVMCAVKSCHEIAKLYNYQLLVQDLATVMVMTKWLSAVVTVLPLPCKVFMVVSIIVSLLTVLYRTFSNLGLTKVPTFEDMYASVTVL